MNLAVEGEPGYARTANLFGSLQRFVLPCHLWERSSEVDGVQVSALPALHWELFLILGVPIDSLANILFRSVPSSLCSVLGCRQDQ